MLGFKLYHVSKRPTPPTHPPSLVGIEYREKAIFTPNVSNFSLTLSNILLKEFYKHHRHTSLPWCKETIGRTALDDQRNLTE